MSKKQRQNKYKVTSIIPPDSAPKNVEFRNPNAKSSLKSSPWFSFRYICQKEFCVKKCSYEKLKAYSDKLRQLSILDWATIESSPHETNGVEMIEIRRLNASLPIEFSKHTHIHIFRFGGCGRVGSKTSGRIAGIKENERFYVLFIDREFSLYDHGS
jgi:hypothetical protein